MTITNSTIANNTAPHGGGVHNLPVNGTVNILSSTLFGNTATGNGGGISSFGTLKLENATLFNNSALIGGGVFSTGTLTTINSTIANNSATTSGGGVANFGTLHLTNSIIANSTGSEDCYSHNGLVATSIKTLIKDNAASPYQCGSPFLNEDPKLGSLADNGGSTQTLALLPGSPAIDAGDDASCPDTDQRGVTRPQSSHCDIGAFEYQEEASPSIVSIVRTSTSPTSASSVNFTVTFSEPVTGVDADGSDFSLVTSGVSGASITNVSGSGSSYTVSVNTGSGNGTIRLDVPDTASISDLSGNPLSDLPFTSGEAYEVVKSATLTLYSIPSQDGWLLESSETSGLADRLNRGSPLLFIGDDAANKQYLAFLSFDTAALPDNAVLTKVTLKFKHAGVSGSLPFNTHGALRVDIKKGSFSNNPALNLGDFKNPPSKSQLLSYNKNKPGNWYTRSFDPADFHFINLTGLSQFRLRFAKDDNNDLGPDYLRIFSGNAPAADQPKLIIEYYVP
jgi:hypothetical protein